MRGLRPRTPPEVHAFRAGALLVLAALGWLVVAESIAASSRRGRPDVALSALPFDARAKAEQASRQQLELGARDAQGRAARQLALEALGRDPTLAQAARALGVEYDKAGKPELAARAMRYSDALTRRDVLTQLWLLEYHVAREEVPQVLQHFYAALTTEPEIRPVLYPILLKALATPDLQGPIADMLKRDPEWVPAFLQSLGAEGNPKVALSLFLALADRGVMPTPNFIQYAIDRLPLVGETMPPEKMQRLQALIEKPLPNILDGRPNN